MMTTWERIQTSSSFSTSAFTPSISLDTYLNRLLRQDSKITKDRDVDELYLANLSSSIRFDAFTAIARFRHLKVLWLNGNKLRHLAPGTFSSTLSLTELYLHNNLLSMIRDVLRPLTCLRILTLHDNELVSLKEICRECKVMQMLENLNLSGNPASQQKHYRFSVIHSLTAVQVLDRRRVEDAERTSAAAVLDRDREALRQTISFGRRIPEKPAVAATSRHATAPRMSPRLYRHKEPRVHSVSTSIGLEAEGLDLESRAAKRSWMEYKAFGWTNSKTGNKPITVRFR
eukprot:m.311643 g.311643  ORF g.311643 m.311643 type:complete len:287 (+) comp93821_c0_seq1:1-861(+)